ncbi:MAG: hypothetical protein P8169_05660, partial [Chloroflexota bacterium]
MPAVNDTSTNSSLLTLWLRLIEELAGVYDAHFVCAIIAAEVASFTGITTVIGLSGAQGEFYDVWICQPDGEVSQARWPSESAYFAPLTRSNDAVRLEKLGRPVTEVINSELWLIAQDNILAAPLPYPGNGDQPSASAGVICLIDPPQDCMINRAELAHLARGLTVYLDRAGLRRQVDHQEVEFGVISEISHVLTSTLSMERVYQELTGNIRRILHVESISVGLTDPKSGEVMFI